MKITEIRDRRLIRLILEEYRHPPVLRKLVDDKGEEEILAELENVTSALRIAELRSDLALNSRELVFMRRERDLGLYSHIYINAAFTHTRPTGNRFNGGDRGAWYCSYDIETSLSEVGFHRTRELGYIGVFEDEALYFELLADFIGDFPDLDGQPDHPALNPDTAIGYPEGQALAMALRRKGHRGLLYPSVRHPGGRCFVAFDPGIVQNAHPGDSWKLTWTGTPDYSIDRV